MANPGLRPYGYILASCVWFSAMGLLAHEAGREGCPWLIVAAARSTLAAFIAVSAALALGIRLVAFRPRMLWIRSLSGSCSLLATFYALIHMEVSEVLTITNTFPVWVALLSWPLAGEKPTIGVWIAVLCSVAGVAFALQPESEAFRWKPALLAFCASFFTAVAMLGLNRLKGIAPLAVVVHFSTVSALICLGLLVRQHFLVRDAIDFEKLERPELIGMLLGIGATAAVGQIFLTRAFATGSPTKVSVVGLSQVVMVLAAESLMDRRPINWRIIVGTALVLGPVAWLMARERRPPKAPDETELEEVAIE
jgi:drug/metabolite transporter (DMT)-like permease